MALDAKVGDAVCADEGTLIAQWLFWQIKSAGTFHTPAKFAAL